MAELGGVHGRGRGAGCTGYRGNRADRAQGGSGLRDASGLRRCGVGRSVSSVGEMRAMAVEFSVVLGQPGRLTHLEERVERHEQAVERLKGLAGAFGGVLTMLHLAIDYLRR
jgi:hypothetical protein